jgi:hypothetical protein
MNWRVPLGGFLAIACLVTFGLLLTQRNHLAALLVEQQRLTARLAARTAPSTSAATDEGAGTGPSTRPAALVVTPELLRLRSEVTRLTERKRELENVRAENERLIKAQLASRGTNGTAASGPPGYLRRTEARMVGYQTPEDTLQSLLWALQSHNITNVLQAFTPDQAESLLNEITNGHKSFEEFFRKAAELPGMRVVDRTINTNDGSVALEVEIVPGMTGSRVPLQQRDGEWKIAGPF